MDGARVDRLWRSAFTPIVLQKSFAGSVKNSEGRWRVLRVMIRGTSSPCAKFMGDFGSATEAVRIIDLFALQVFAKNFDRCNFRVLQHNHAESGSSPPQAAFPKSARNGHDSARSSGAFGRREWASSRSAVR